MKTYSLYDASTGLFVGRTFSTNDREDRGEHARAVAANIPAGHGAVTGDHDHLSKRVDLAKAAEARTADLAAHAVTVAAMREQFSQILPGQAFREPPAPSFIASAAHVIDYQPPAPSADHEWNAETKRWQPNPTAVAATQARQIAMAAISALEMGQPRAVREAVLGIPGALERLRDIDSQIITHRAGLGP